MFKRWAYRCSRWRAKWSAVRQQWVMIVFKVFTKISVKDGASQYQNFRVNFHKFRAWSHVQSSHAWCSVRTICNVFDSQRIDRICSDGVCSHHASPIVTSSLNSEECFDAYSRMSWTTKYGRTWALTWGVGARSRGIYRPPSTDFWRKSKLIADIHEILRIWIASSWKGSVKAIMNCINVLLRENTAPLPPVWAMEAIATM
jgi:hypothetical protein